MNDTLPKTSAALATASTEAVPAFGTPVLRRSIGWVCWGVVLGCPPAVLLAALGFPGAGLLKLMPVVGAWWAASRLLRVASAHALALEVQRVARLQAALCIGPDVLGAGVFMLLQAAEPTRMVTAILVAGATVLHLVVSGQTYRGMRRLSKGLPAQGLLNTGTRPR